jgi:hypothetical protein
LRATCDSLPFYRQMLLQGTTRSKCDRRSSVWRTFPAKPAFLLSALPPCSRQLSK